jgi:uncharacterized protein
MTPQKSRELQSGEEKSLTKARIYSSLASYAALLLMAWLVVRRLTLAADLGARLPYAFCSFALLLAPLWFFGFGWGEWLRDSTRSRGVRVLLSAGLGIPYLVFALPTGNFRVAFAIFVFALPLLLATSLEYAPLSAKVGAQDAVALAVLVAVYMLRLLAGAWPYHELAALPKLFVADITLYLYVVVRKLEGIGYSFMVSRDALVIGLREWIYFLPFGIGLGFAIGFIHFHARMPALMGVATGVLATFLLVAIPEELFFRGILQNLLETRVGRNAALMVTAILFGLAHFNKGATFNWRYVLLAAIAGIFYGRAWRARRQLLASVITHTAVDVVWSVWFR